MKVVHILFLILLLCISLFSKAQITSKTDRIVFHYLPWGVKGMGTRLDVKDVIGYEEKESITITNIEVINKFFSSIELSNLKLSTKSTIDVWMVINIFRQDILIESYSIGQPVLVPQKLSESDSIKPPLFVADNRVYIGLLNITMNDKIYRTNYELTKFILTYVAKNESCN
ncbi:hypothetical protein EYV94_22890 [Puteibacter caeruleilacunae]|nr:hypothetical protein EYV94_22890 [Puteibacter caeruleilacunae]